MPRPLQILMCESNELTAHMMRRLLEIRGHVPAVMTVEQALAATEGRAFDRLLIDTLLLPEQASLELLERFDKADVIAVSSLAPRSASEACSAVGITALVSKPVLATELWAALGDMV